MHFVLYVMTDKANAKTSMKARSYVYDWLEREGFASEGTRFSSGICDWYVIGGRWSGEFTKKSLDDSKIQAFEKEFEKKHGFWTNGKISKTDRLEQSKKLFSKYFPDFDGVIPYWRDDYASHGAEDDAVIVDEDIYKKIVKNGRAGDISDGGAVIDTDDYCGEKKDIVGKKWIVVIDFHC